MCATRAVSAIKYFEYSRSLRFLAVWASFHFVFILFWLSQTHTRARAKYILNCGAHIRCSELKIPTWYWSESIIYTFLFFSSSLIPCIPCASFPFFSLYLHNKNILSSMRSTWDLINLLCIRYVRVVTIVTMMMIMMHCCARDDRYLFFCLL